jgi:polyisoprenoid-binding protein YceI
MKPVYTIDQAHSAINFSVRHMVFAKVRGRFDRWTADLELDDEDITRSHVEVEIESDSIDTNEKKRDDHLRSDDFLDSESFPTLSFRSTKVEPGKKGHFDVVGELTIRDVTREVVLDVELEGRGTDPWGNERISFSASTRIDRSEFGLRWNQVLEAGGVLVGDKVDIQIDVQAVRKSASKAA